MAGIGICPSNPGMGEIKLSKACIQTNKLRDSEKVTKLVMMRAPYWVPFYPDMVGAHLLIGLSASGVLEHLFQEHHQVLRDDLRIGLLSWILNSAIFPTRVNLFLQRDNSVGQLMGGHANSYQAALF
jgi:hypothetical protein